MKYFLDTEFLEGPQKEKFPVSLFRKQTPPTIDLISIGIVAEDGREFYEISKDFNLDEAWNRFQIEQQSGDMRNIFPEGKKVYWIRENVLYPIFAELFEKHNPEIWHEDFGNIGNFKGYFERYGNGKKCFKELLHIYGKTNKEISQDVALFCFYKTKIQGGDNTVYMNPVDNIEFYAYYADYDWVVFCWLFGNMIDLPTGFPMYCNDLKQDLNSLVSKQISFYVEKKRPEEKPSFEAQLNYIKRQDDYPKQEKEHNALEDARWNKKLFEFLNKI